MLAKEDHAHTALAKPTEDLIASKTCWVAGLQRREQGHVLPCSAQVAKARGSPRDSAHSRRMRPSVSCRLDISLARPDRDGRTSRSQCQHTA
jgi:hypothetical protein